MSREDAPRFFFFFAPRFKWSQNCSETGWSPAFPGVQGNGWSCFPATLLQRGRQLLCGVTLQVSYSGGIGPDPPTDPQRQNSEGSQKGGKKELPPGRVCYFMAGSQDIHVGGFFQITPPPAIVRMDLLWSKVEKRLGKNFIFLIRSIKGFPGSSVVKNPPANAGDMVSIPELGRSPGEGNGNPSSILAWEIPWTEEPGGLQSMGLQSQTWLSY